MKRKKRYKKSELIYELKRWLKEKYAVPDEVLDKVDVELEKFIRPGTLDSGKRQLISYVNANPTSELARLLRPYLEKDEKLMKIYSDEAVERSNINLMWDIVREAERDEEYRNIVLKALEAALKGDKQQIELIREAFGMSPGEFAERILIPRGILTEEEYRKMIEKVERPPEVKGLLELRPLLEDIDREIEDIKRKKSVFERRIKRKDIESVKAEVTSLINKLREKDTKLDKFKKIKGLKKYVAEAKEKITDAVRELEALLEEATKARELEERIREEVSRRRELEKRFYTGKLKAVARATLKGLGHDPTVIQRALEFLNPTIVSLATALTEGTIKQEEAEDQLSQKIVDIFGRAEIFPEELIRKIEDLTDSVEKAMAYFFGDEIAMAIRKELEERIEEVAKERIKAERGLPKRIKEEVKEKYRTYVGIREAILRDKEQTPYICPTCNLEAALRGEPEPNNPLLTSPETKGWFYCPICGGLFRISPTTGNPVLVHRFHD